MRLTSIQHDNLARLYSGRAALTQDPQEREALLTRARTFNLLSALAKTHGPKDPNAAPTPRKPAGN